MIALGVRVPFFFFLSCSQFTTCPSAKLGVEQMVLAIYTGWVILSDEDKARLRLSEARLEAIRISPAHYSRFEIEEALISNWKLRDELVSSYGIDDSRNWAISVATGVIHIGSEYVP